MPKGQPGTIAPHGTITRYVYGCRCLECQSERRRYYGQKPMAEHLAIVEAKHGTESRASRCSCADCRAAANAARNRRRLENGPGPNAVHGKRTTYSNGCRCGECRRAHADYQRQRRRKQVA